MLDVHPPHEPVHGIRDFLLHLLTITVGLLIALGLEGTVEWRHHVHVRDEADASIVAELRDNAHELDKAMDAVESEQQSLMGALAFLQARAAGKPYNLTGINLGLTLYSGQDASWKTAASTGAVSFMEYSHVKRYAEAYTRQAQFTALQERTLDSYLQLQSYIVGGFDPDKFSAADADKARIDIHQTLARLLAMQQIGTSLQAEYRSALK